MHPLGRLRAVVARMKIRAPGSMATGAFTVTGGEERSGAGTF